MHSNPRAAKLNRRDFIKTAALGAGAVLVAPAIRRASAATPLLTRPLGRTGLEVTTFGLGGQASLQWTGEGIEPEAIIAKACQMGATYFDTSNVYDRSQLNYGAAFRALGLAPGRANYDERKRRGIVVATKTMIRYARGDEPRPRTQGTPGSRVVDDIKRSLTQVFGDGLGGYPDDAYFDIFQIHNLTGMDQVDMCYAGLDDPSGETVGALAALRDYRDGTNLTGLNPKEEKRIRHIGITGHRSSPVLMEFIQRDEQNLIDTILTVANVNDRRYFNHQYNVIPVAAAKNLGVISMKVFADGAMYTKPAHWTQGPHEVVLSVGSPDLPSTPLVQYPLSVPGVTTSIIGIGHIDNDPGRCQLEQNIRASQLHDPLDAGAMREAEELGLRAKEGLANYFQSDFQPLTPPQEPAVAQAGIDGARTCRLTWHTAFAGDAPISAYEIVRDGQVIATVPHAPQTSKTPFSHSDRQAGTQAREYRIRAVDTSGRTAETEPLVAEAVA